MTLFAAALFCPPALSLSAGILFALTPGNPDPQQSKKGSNRLLQACVVGPGFGMDFHVSLAAGECSSRSFRRPR